MTVRKVSVKVSTGVKVDDKELAVIINGDLENLPPLSNKHVRVFISSTFSDMLEERNALMKNVYEKLKKYCQENYRLEFQMIDLRWGLREESQDNHTIIEFCIKEILHCKNLSIGPTFVALLGQKYGFRSFPSSINKNEFEKIKNILIKNNYNINILNKWFIIDNNIIPPLYVIKPISTILKNFNHPIKKEQEKDKEEWNKIFKELLEILRIGISLCIKDNIMPASSKDKYFISVTEYEIEKGLLEVKDANKTSLCFTRNIYNLNNYIYNDNIYKFIDMIPGSNQIDQDAQKMLEILKEKKISPLLEKAGNIHHFNVAWEALDQKNIPQNNEYLNKFCQTFENKMKKLISEAVVNMKNIRNWQISEPHQHLNMCKSRSLIFRGRENIMEILKNYLSTPSRYPFILYGFSGSGKTSVLARFASNLPSWFPQNTPSLIVKFLGTTSHSCSIRLVLFNLCWHLSFFVFDKEVEELPGDYPNLVKLFHDLIQNMKNSSKKIVIILDSIDQLSHTHKAHNLHWLPKLLPPNVHMVLSTLPYEHDLLENLKLMFKNKSYFYEIKPLGFNISMSLVREWLDQAGRKLTEEQEKVVNGVLMECSLPLYSRLVFEEICRWPSYHIVDKRALQPTIKGLINQLLENLEKNYGKIFVKHSLSYLTASKNGLSDVELEDVLSLDDDVLNDVFEHWVPPVRRIPPLLIPRLHDALSSYLMEREANGIIVYYWYHRQFIFVARERYLKCQAHKIYIHTYLAHYFLGTWAGGIQKIYKNPSKTLPSLPRPLKEIDKADRMVPLQPLYYKNDNKINYNLRKLSELPYHLLESKRFIELCLEVLLNYEWLHSKLTSMSLHEVLSDFRVALETFNTSHDFKVDVSLVFNALRVGGSYVNSNPDTLAFDLLGRLLIYYGDNHTYLRKLLQQCDDLSRVHSALLPIHQCFDTPKSMLLYTLEDHSQTVVFIIFLTKDLISISTDGVIACWDPISGECIKTMNIQGHHFGPLTKLYTNPEETKLVVDCDEKFSPIFVFNLKSGQLEHSSLKRSTNLKRSFMAGNILCRQKEFFDLKSLKVKKTLDDFQLMKTFNECKLTPNERFILIGNENGSQLFEFETGGFKAKFTSFHPPSVIEISNDSSTAYVGYWKNCSIDFLNIFPENSHFGQKITIFSEDNHKSLYNKMLGGEMENCAVNEIAISPLDNKVIAINIKRRNLILLHTKHAFIPTILEIKQIDKSNLCFSDISFNFNAVLLLANNNHEVLIWDLKSNKLINTLSLHSRKGFPRAVSMASNFFATSSTIHTAINIWDLEKAKMRDICNTTTYEAPVDTMAPLSANRLFFVKKRITNEIRYLDSFGIDIWNAFSGKKETFLPFGQYGVLEQMECSQEGEFLGLFVSNKESYLIIYNIKAKQIIFHQSFVGLKSFKTSVNWNFLCVSSYEKECDILTLFNLSDNKSIKFQKAKCPIFINNYFVCIDSDIKILIYNLKTMAPSWWVECNPENLLPIYGNESMIIVDKTKENKEIELWQIKSQIRIYSISNNSSIKDISLDGRYMVDSGLQVFSVKDGSPKHNFLQNIDENGFDISFIRLTDDGNYLVWVEGYSVKVGSINKMCIVANTCTHEKPSSLCFLDHGYTIIIGREDGKLLITKLMDHTDKTKPYSLSSRAEFLLESEKCERFFPDYFQYKIKSVKNNDMPKSHDSLKHELLSRSKKSVSGGTLPKKKHKRASSSSNILNWKSDSKETLTPSPRPVPYISSNENNNNNNNNNNNFFDNYFESKKILNKDENNLKNRSRSYQDIINPPITLAKSTEDVEMNGKIDGKMDGKQKNKIKFSTLNKKSSTPSMTLPSFFGFMNSKNGSNV